MCKAIRPKEPRAQKDVLRTTPRRRSEEFALRVDGADVVRFMAERARAKITEAEGSHVIMVSKPQVVAEVILTALAAAPQDIHPTA